MDNIRLYSSVDTKLSVCFVQVSCCYKIAIRWLTYILVVHKQFEDWWRGGIPCYRWRALSWAPRWTKSSRRQRSTTRCTAWEPDLASCPFLPPSCSSIQHLQALFYLTSAFQVILYLSRHHIVIQSAKDVWTHNVFPLRIVPSRHSTLCITACVRTTK